MDTTVLNRGCITTSGLRLMIYIQFLNRCRECGMSGSGPRPLVLWPGGTGTLTILSSVVLAFPAPAAPITAAMCESDDLPEENIMWLRFETSRINGGLFKLRQTANGVLSYGGQRWSWNSFIVKVLRYVRVWVLFNFRDKSVSGL